MKKIVRLAYILAIFILIDLTATICWVAYDLGQEANPIMAFFLDVSPLLFVLAKLGLSAAGIWILYFFRKRFTKVIFRALLVLNFIYISVFVYHLWGLLFLLFTTI
tara:strand:- start:68430 stop:68747 length:318 start_codon:yes stop_codon:yes gene_type:complete